MTAMPPDPEPERTTGLEPGGGVRPGETPPESGSTTEGLAQRQRYPSRVLPVVTLVLVALLTVAVVALVIAQVTGLINVL